MHKTNKRRSTAVATLLQDPPGEVRDRGHHAPPLTKRACSTPVAHGGPSQRSDLTFSLLPQLDYRFLAFLVLYVCTLFFA
jgi:hypothetical protein